MRKYLCHYTTSHGCSELFEKLQASETSSFNGEERLIKWSRWSFGSVHVVKLINKDHADENSEPTLIWLLVDLLFEIFLTNVEKSGNQKSKVIVGELRTISNSLTPAMEWLVNRAVIFFGKGLHNRGLFNRVSKICLPPMRKNKFYISKLKKTNNIYY